jgi:hypothetical protein
MLGLSLVRSTAPFDTLNCPFVDIRMEAELDWLAIVIAMENDHPIFTDKVIQLLL